MFHLNSLSTRTWHCSPDRRVRILNKFNNFIEKFRRYSTPGSRSDYGSSGSYHSFDSGSRRNQSYGGDGGRDDRYEELKNDYH